MYEKRKEKMLVYIKLNNEDLQHWSGHISFMVFKTLLT